MKHHQLAFQLSLVLALVSAACAHLPGGLGGSSPAESSTKPASTPPEPPAASPKGPPATSSAASITPSCSGIEARRHDVDFNDVFRSDGEIYPKVRAQRRKLIVEAGPGDFIAANQDVTENDLGSGKKNPEIVLKKGEPLLHLACSERYSTHDVMTMSLHRVHNVPTKLIDRAPTAYVFPDAPTLWDFDAHDAYVNASPDDLAAVPGAAESEKVEAQCADKALDACAVASKKVKAAAWRPDTDERADEACELAKVKERNRCMGSSAGHKYEQNARKLDDLRRNQEKADFQKLKARFAKRSAVTER